MGIGIKADLGQFIDPTKLKVSDGEYLDLETGRRERIENLSTGLGVSPEVTLASEDVTLVKGLDKKTFYFKLASSYGEQVPSSGYLVEIFLSESDGLRKMSYKDVIDPFTGDTLEEGFINYFKVKIK